MSLFYSDLASDNIKEHRNLIEKWWISLLKELYYMYLGLSWRLKLWFKVVRECLSRQALFTLYWHFLLILLSLSTCSLHVYPLVARAEVRVPSKLTLRNLNFTNEIHNYFITGTIFVSNITFCLIKLNWFQAVVNKNSNFWNSHVWAEYPNCLTTEFQPQWIAMNEYADIALFPIRRS